MSNSINSSEIESLFMTTWQDYIEKGGYRLEEQVEKYLLDIMKLPFTSCTTECYDFFKKNINIIHQRFGFHIEPTLFFLIESYLRDKTPASMEQLEAYLKSVREKDFDPSGINLLRSGLADGVLVKNVYRSGDPDLIQLFKKYLPRPNPDQFARDGGSIPDGIIEDANQAAATIQALTQLHGREALEQSTVAMQRKVRGIRRRKQELNRVMKIEECDEREAERRIRSGDRPYMPQCEDRHLSLRIFNAAFLVPNYPTMNHVTSAAFLPQILDRCLYGRHSLTARYLAFRPAQLYPADRENGDANAICFAPQEIDAGVWKPESVQIILDMEKFRENRMERHNPCIFFKGCIGKQL